MKLSRRSVNSWLTLLPLGIGSLLSPMTQRSVGISEHMMKNATRMGSRNIVGKTNGSAQRRYPSWIDRFVESTSGSEAPEAYRRWAAIVGVAATLQQETWLQTKKSKLFPNLYAFLVGPPGVGKSETIKAIRPYLQEVEVQIASTSVTGASLADEMEEAKISYVESAQSDHIQYHSMLLMPDELSALLSEYSSALVAVMTTFYDVGHYSERRRHSARKEPLVLDHPQLSILAGTTTSHLVRTLPSQAWDEGFMSRTIIIYSPASQRQGDMFDEAADTFDPALQEDLHHIKDLRGQFAIGDSYREAYREWRDRDCLPEPEHPRLRSYCARREAHLLKLSMVATADESDLLRMERRHFDRAYGWLTQAELTMSHTFHNISTPDTRAVEEALFTINGKTITEGQLSMFLSQRMPMGQVGNAIKMMVSGGMIMDLGPDQSGRGRLFKVPRRA